MAGMEDELLARLLRQLRRFNTVNGRFKPDASSAQLLAEVRKLLESVISNERLREAARELLPDFDRIATNTSIMHGEESGIVVSKSLMSDAKKRMVDMTIDSVITGGYDARFALPVKKLLYNHVNFGADVIETERALRTLISGKTNNGLMQQYAGQVARDSISQYEGQVHTEIAQQYELDNWRYVGNIIATTRPQCARWVKKGIITGAEVNSEIRWALRNGSGMIPGTTKTTWPVYRGGYNCLHTAIPTRRQP